MTTGLEPLLGLPRRSSAHLDVFMLRIESQTHSWAGDTCFTGGQTAETHRGTNGKTGFKPTSGCLAAHSVCSLLRRVTVRIPLWNFREKASDVSVCFSLAPGVRRFKGSFGRFSECQRGTLPGSLLSHNQSEIQKSPAFYRGKNKTLIYFILQIGSSARHRLI